MLNVNRLRVLREVAARGSFSAAADAMSYTQSAVSQQIAALEHEVGTRLIDRRPRGLRLTAAGEVLVEHADGILARLEAAEEALEAIAGLRGGRLRMASFPSAGATVMPMAIARFRSEHPLVELSLAEGEPEEILPRLRAGELDIALLYEFRAVSDPPDGDLARTDLFADPMYVALPAAHPLAANPQIELAELAGEAWVQTSEQTPCAQHVVRSCHGAGFEPRVAFESDDYATVQGLVAAGVGVALIPELALSSVRGDIVIRDLTPQSPERVVLAATGADVGITPAAGAMLALLVESARARPRRRARAGAS